MKKTQPGVNYFFVDESGDPTFYDRKGNYIVGQDGCSPLLLLGFIETQDPAPIRSAMLELQQEITADLYFRDVPSLARTRLAFHAKDDLPEIRYRVFKLLSRLDFKAQFVVARKVESVFCDSFHADERKFYDHLVSQLFQNTLHRYEENRIYFAKRGSRERQAPLALAIRQGLSEFEMRWKTQVVSEFAVQAQTSSGEPCLSVVDYMNWAVYRAFVRGEMRYFQTVANKVSLLVDLYDHAKYPKNWYNRKNPFDVTRITPL